MKQKEKSLYEAERKKLLEYLKIHNHNIKWGWSSCFVCLFAVICFIWGFCKSSQSLIMDISFFIGAFIFGSLLIYYIFYLMYDYTQIGFIEEHYKQIKDIKDKD